jgi:hypothetical protein
MIVRHLHRLDRHLTTPGLAATRSDENRWRDPPSAPWQALQPPLPWLALPQLLVSLLFLCCGSIFYMNSIVARKPRGSMRYQIWARVRELTHICRCKRRPCNYPHHNRNSSGRFHSYRICYSTLQLYTPWSPQSYGKRIRSSLPNFESDSLTVVHSPPSVPEPQALTNDSRYCQRCQRIR